MKNKSASALGKRSVASRIKTYGSKEKLAEHMRTISKLPRPSRRKNKAVYKTVSAPFVGLQNDGDKFPNIPSW